MPTFLFDSIIFGPVWSRRLGESLGINLLPVNRKVCNFNCVYCECGLTPKENPGGTFSKAHQVKELLKAKLLEMKLNGVYLDTITFAGNGEPTLHPEFPQILDDTLEIRKNIYPSAKVAVLSNATLIGREEVFNSLLKVDLNVLKLDSAIEDTLFAINCPNYKYNLSDTLSKLKLFNGKLIIQTLFFRGLLNGKKVDNTTEIELLAWLSALKQIHPESVMIYSIARDTAISGLDVVSPDELHAISQRVENMGIRTQVNP